MNRRIPVALVIALLIAHVVQAQYSEPSWIRSGSPAPVTDLAFSGNGRWLASVALDGSLKIWDLQSNRLYRYIGSALATSAVFYPDNVRVVTGASDGSVRIWNINTGELIQSINAHNGRVAGVDISPNGQYLASAGSDAIVKIWKAADYTIFRTIPGPTGAVNSVHFSPDNGSLVTASDDRSVRIWSVTTGQQSRIWSDTSLHLGKAAVYSPSGSTIAATSGECFYTSSGCGITVFNVNDGSVAKQFQQIVLDATDVSYSSSGLLIASADNRGSVYTYRADSLSAQPVVRIRHRAGPQGSNFLAVNTVHFSPDGSMLASAGNDRVIRYWKASDNSTGVLVDSSGAVAAAATSSAGDAVALGRSDGIVEVRDANDGAIRQWLARIDSASIAGENRWTYYQGPSVLSVAWRPDGAQLAVGLDDDSLRIWNPTNGTLSNTVDAGASTVGLAWTTAGDKLLSGHGSPVNGVKVWNTSNWTAERTLDCAGSRVTAVAVRGNYVVAGDGDGHLRTWSTADWSLVRDVEQQVGAIVSVACSADGKLVASATTDTFRIAALAEGTELSYGTVPAGTIRAIAFGPDNSSLIITTSTGAISVCRAASGFLTYNYVEYLGDLRSMAVASTYSFIGTADGSTIKWPFKSGNPAGELSSPGLVSPANSTTNLTAPVVLTWNRVAGVDGYDLQVSSENTFTTGLITNAGNLADTIGIVANVNTGVTYYWRVRARTASLRSAWTETWSFTMQGGVQLAVPKLANPPDQATNVPLTVVLSWDQALGAEWYRMQFADNDAFSTPILDEQQINDTSYRVTGLKASTTYYWHVRSRRNGSPSTSPWSATYHFTTTSVTSVDDAADADALLSVTVAPVPVVDAGEVRIAHARRGRLQANVVDVSGKVVRHLTDEMADPGLRVLSVDSADLSPGTYFILVSVDDHATSARFVVNR